MASLLSPLLRQKHQHANRTTEEDLRLSEASLLVDYACGRYASPEHDISYTHLELTDTLIPRSAVPIKSASFGSSTGSCQMFPSTSRSCQIFPSVYDREDEDITGDELTIHGVKVVNKTSHSSNTPQATIPLVMLHGYANGCVYFYRNLISLSQTYFPTIYALDMLGFGLSSRPRFETTPDDTSVESAEAFFVESLEAWRIKNKIDKMIIAGHSIGGYMSVAYAEKYPERVERLILISPVGVPDSSTNNFAAHVKTLPFTKGMTLKTIRYLFDKGFTPSMVLRSMPGSQSKQLVLAYVERRLPTIDCPEEQSVFADYLHQSAMLRGSGEHCLSRILTLNPGAYAKKPLLYRIPRLNVNSVHFLIGQNDWVDVEGGLDVQSLCSKRRTDGLFSPQINVYGIRDAGHLLMIDNPYEFNSALIMAGGGEHALSSNAPRPRQFDYLGTNHESFFRESQLKAQRSKEQQSIKDIKEDTKSSPVTISQ